MVCNDELYLRIMTYVFNYDLIIETYIIYSFGQRICKMSGLDLTFSVS